MVGSMENKIEGTGYEGRGNRELEQEGTKKEMGGEERQKDTKRKTECEQMDIPTHHTAAQALFGKLQQRNEGKKDTERGREERQKDTKGKIECEQMDIFTHYAAGGFVW